MPSVFLYLGILLLTICVWFMLFKRPVYEAVFISFLILLTASRNGLLRSSRNVPVSL